MGVAIAPEKARLLTCRALLAVFQAAADLAVDLDVLGSTLRRFRFVGVPEIPWQRNLAKCLRNGASFPRQRSHGATVVFQSAAYLTGSVR